MSKNANSSDIDEASDDVEITVILPNAGRYVVTLPKDRPTHPVAKDALKALLAAAARHAS